MNSLRPFWRYYGGKWRAAPRYPKPQHDTIIEPFAGSAGYSLRYANRRVILVEKYPVIAEMWRYLIGVSSKEIRSIPTVTSVDDLPAWVPQGGRWLVGSTLNAATTAPRRTLSAGLSALGGRFDGWTPATRERVAQSVGSIRHWQIIEGDYTAAPDIEATWFIDPPYNNGPGMRYVHGPSSLDYQALGDWCQARRGRVVVCENEGADWLPFQPFATFKPGVNGKGSREVVYVQDG